MQKTKEIAKLDLQDIWPIALVLVVTGIGVALSLNVIQDVKPGFCTYGFNASNDHCLNSTGGVDFTVDGVPAQTVQLNATLSSELSVSRFMEKIPTIALVIVAAILIGILIRNLGGMGGGGGGEDIV